MILLANSSPSLLGKLFGLFINFIFEFVYKICPQGSLFITIIIFTILVKLLLLPLAIKQQKSMLSTKAMQPELTRLQNKYKNKNDQESQQAMAKEMQELYSKHGTNPFASCIVTFIQFPIIIALFDVCKTVHLYIGKLGNIYTDIANMIMSKVPNYLDLLTNLGAAKKLANVDYSEVLNVESLLTTLNKNDWTALLGDISSHVDVNLINDMLIKKNQIETIFGINLINRPSIRSISIILPIITVLLTYISVKRTTKDQDLESMDEKSKKMITSMNSFMKIIMVSIFFTSISLPAALSIYWSLNTLIQMVQQELIKKYVKLDETNDEIVVNDVKETKEKE